MQQRKSLAEKGTGSGDATGEKGVIKDHGRNRGLVTFTHAISGQVEDVEFAKIESYK